jgi:hypothetical protein
MDGARLHLPAPEKFIRVTGWTVMFSLQLLLQQIGCLIRPPGDSHRVTAVHRGPRFAVCAFPAVFFPRQSDKSWQSWFRFLALYRSIGMDPGYCFDIPKIRIKKILG